MEKRIWIGTGIVEVLDKRQKQFLDLVLDKIKFYYRELYQRKGNPYPLNLNKLKKLTNRNATGLISAIRLLANSVPEGFNGKPPIYYERRMVKRNYNRPYLIFLNRS